VAFGGAGPLHACELATVLRIPRVLIPPYPGVLSALGMVMADVTKDYSQTVMLPAEKADAATLDRLFIPLYEQARADLRLEGYTNDRVQLFPALDMRYVGQSYELVVDIEATGAGHEEGKHLQDFHISHRRRFSYASEREPVEIVNLRLKAVGQTAKPQFSHHPATGLDPKAAHIGYKKVHFAEDESSRAARPIFAALYARERLAPGNIVVGPSVVFQLDTTTVIPPGWAAIVDGWGNLVMERRATDQEETKP
jgi:N-methylhydantoinase A